MTCSIHERNLILQETRESANTSIRASGEQTRDNMIDNAGKNVGTFAISSSSSTRIRGIQKKTTSRLPPPPPTSLSAASSKGLVQPEQVNHHDHTTMYEAKEHVAMFLQSSRQMGKHIHEIPTFDSSELMLGRWLGKGGFSNVEELRGFVHIPEALRPKRKQTSLRLFANLRDFRGLQTSEEEEEEEGDASSSFGQDDKIGGIPSPEELGYESHEKDNSETTPADDSITNTSCYSELPTCFGGAAATDGATATPFDNEAGRNFLMQNCLRDTGEARYAIKRLRKEIVQDPNQFPSGAMDMAVEALFLADLAHPNIVKLRGIATRDPFATGTGSSAAGSDDYYFLVLDRLQDTLTGRIKKWKERKRRLDTLLGRLTDVRGRKRQQLLDERLAAAFDLSAAMSYLKQNRILHRDIKPENLGFDIRGDIKIFDFGLARELRTIDKDPDLPGMYRLSNMTGSLRYMAPEVARMGTPYNEACDIYSFSIVFWEILSLQRAYLTVGTSKELFMNKVYQEKMRPPIRYSWSRNLRELLQRGWDHDPTQRLTAEQCNEILRNELVSMRHGDDEGLDHVRRRSTYVMEDEGMSCSLPNYRNRSRSMKAGILPMKSASMNNVIGYHKNEEVVGPNCVESTAF